MALVDCASDKNPIASISAIGPEVIIVPEDRPSDKKTEVISVIGPKLIEALVDRPSDINPTAMRDALNLLSRYQSQLRALADWCKTAANRVKLHNPGPDAEKLEWLVEQCDGILKHYTGKNICRTYKDERLKEFVTRIANSAAAAAGIKPFTHGSIARAMKVVIARRNAGVQGRKSASALE
jgi:hypothetical protein